MDIISLLREDARTAPQLARASEQASDTGLALPLVLGAAEGSKDQKERCAVGSVKEDRTQRPGHPSVSAWGGEERGHRDRL